MNNLDLFRPADINPTQGIVNVASVPQRSPFRYPGGKTWLVPIIRKWLKSFDGKQVTLVDTFAGGGIVALTAAFENLAKDVIMIEKDEEVAAVWKAILGPENHWLVNRIMTFNLTIENVREILDKQKKSPRESGFRTILKNRVFHGGILAKGSGLIKHGENGKGIASRWYPKTLGRRIAAIEHIKNKIRFIGGDAFTFLEENLSKKNYCYFIDPPYTVAGRRLYTYHDVNHNGLFESCARLKGGFLMTYDDSEEIRALAHKFNFPYITIPMKTTHHLQKHELLISKSLDWYLV
jgi:DNA adenine methylase